MLDSKTFKRSLVICKISLVPLLPFIINPAHPTDTANRLVVELLRQTYKQNQAKLKELKDFWQDPEKLIRDHILREGVGGGIDRR